MSNANGLYRLYYIYNIYYSFRRRIWDSELQCDATYMFTIKPCIHESRYESLCSLQGQAENLLLLTIQPTVLIAYLPIIIPPHYGTHISSLRV